jgi:CheY-like chemotaxis protein
MTRIIDAFKDLYGEDAHNRTRAVVVDDEPPIARGSGRILRRPAETGIVTTVDFPSAEDALAAITSEKTRKEIALFVSDFNMPGMTGIEFARRLREELGERKIPFVLNSGGFRPETILAADRAISAGLVDTFLLKPFEPDELLAAVEKAILRRIHVSGENDSE